MADSVIHTKYDPTAPALPPQGQLDNFPVLRECAASYLSPAEVEKIERAYEFARAHHRDQKRKSGEPYINHPVEVAIILAKNLHSDVDMLCAGLLHDTVEDTDATLDELSELFGPQVSELVDGVTKLTNISVSSLSEQQALNLRKMFLAMAKDIRVIIIKLADRLHNMRTLMAIPEDRRIFKANETMSIYAPLANRLGISSIKWELEDLSFFYLDPAKYRQVARMVAESRAEREAYLETVKTILRDELTKAKIEHFRIMGRPKHLYSIYMKMKNKGKDFSEIYDLIALRVITDDVRECYGVLGAVHALWTPMPGRFKDYIAMPKFNMYQSLHTTVIGPAGRPLEVQIRTEEMNEHAEYGIAAHWLYKQAGNSDGDKQSSAQRLDDQLAWLGRTLDWTQQDDLSDPQEFLEAVKIDLYDSEVFVFTPAGEVQVLRAGSTPIDFAYAVHTEVGHHCIGAKVNGTVVPLSYELQMGDRVEIITQNNAKPSRDWLNIVKTPSARNKIRAYFSKVTRADDLLSGRDKLAREMRKHGLGISNTRSERALRTVAEHLGYKDADDMLVNIGTSKESVQSVANRLLAELGRKGDQQPDPLNLGTAAMTTGKLPPMLTLVNKPKKHETKSSNGVVVEGVEGALVRLSRCCNPVPGDDIIGFVTRGRGVSVHRRDCPNAKELMAQPERIMKVHWESDLPKNTSFKVEVYIEALDRLQLLSDVVLVLSGMGANVLSSNTVSHRDGMAEMRFLFQVSDITHIDIILSKLKALEGVFDARRMVPKVGGGKDSAQL